MVLSAIIGIESRFPGFDEAILYNISVSTEKEEETPENLGEI